MTAIFSEHEINAIASAAARLERDPAFRTMVLLDMPKALEEIGIPMISGEALRQNLAQAGMSPEELKRFDNATVASSAQGMLEFPVFSQELAAAAAKDKFYRGVAGFQPAAYWWGFHIPFSYDDIKDVFALATAINSLIGTLGGFLAIAAPALKPFVAAILLYILAQSAVIVAVTGGCRADGNAKGVWISMAWIAPGVFVPTCVY